MHLALLRIKNYCIGLMASVTLIACGGGGSSSPEPEAAVACTIGNVSVVYAFPAQLQVGSAVNISPTALPTSCTGVTFNLSGNLPLGLSLNNTTGLVSGTVTNIASSTFTVTAVLPNGAGSVSSSPVTVAVAVIPLVTVSGTALNTVLVNKFANNGGLDFVNPIIKPMRGLMVEAMQNGTVLTSAVTDANGNYSMSLQANSGSISLRIKAALVSTSGPTWNVQVKNNTAGNALYALSSAAFNVASVNITQNMTAGSGWTSTGTLDGNPRASAPFAILDTIYSAMQKVVSAAPLTAFPAVTIFWSADNTTASGNTALGQIGTSYFSSTTGGGVTTRVSYILGKAGVDTDEFDETVVAHEWGHYAQSAFSRDDSVGGAHTFGDKLDMRVAFSEGWGNAWSGIATGRSKYADSSWLGTSLAGFTIDLATSPSAASNRGWFSETSVLYMIYDLNRQVGFKPIWDAILAMKTTSALTSIYSFQANLPAGSASTAMANLMAGQGITGTGSYGAGETNQAITYPPYRTIKVGDPATTVCLDTANGTPNKLGNYAALRFNVPAMGSRTFTLTGGTDPDFEVFQTRLKLRAVTSTAGSEVASVNLDAGEAVVVINDDALTTGSSCLSIKIQ